MNIHYFQHVHFEDLGSIESWIEKKNHKLTSTKFFNNEPLPAVDAVDMLIIMGGPMSVLDEQKFIWLIGEKKFIKSVIQQGKPVLGICLGAQMIADVLGARIFKNEYKEIGWFPIQLTDEGKKSALLQFAPSVFDVFHWHGETFTLPAGAVNLASSEACENQMFLYNNNVLGLQFHLEMTELSIGKIIANCSDELVDGKYIQSENEMVEKSIHIEKVNPIMDRILDGLIK